MAYRSIHASGIRNCSEARENNSGSAGSLPASMQASRPHSQEFIPNVNSYADEVQTTRDTHPNVAKWEVWTMDEHRIGLKPIIRRVWAKQRPTTAVCSLGSSFTERTSVLSTHAANSCPMRVISRFKG